MSHLTKFASLIAVSTALSAASVAAAAAAEATADDTTVQTDEAKQAVQVEEMGSADQESSAAPAPGACPEDASAADPGSTSSGEESVGENPDAASRFFWGNRWGGWGGWGWRQPWGFHHHFVRPGWGFGFQPWWGGFGGCGGGWGGCGVGFC